MNRNLLGKRLDAFLQDSTFFMQILITILKVDVTLKSVLAMQFFNFCLNYCLIVFGASSYVCRSYRGKTGFGGGSFLPFPSPPIMNRVKVNIKFYYLKS